MRATSPVISAGDDVDATTTTQWISYGDAIDTTAPTVTVAEVLSDPAKYLDKEITLVGNIKEVCAKMGCWVRLAPEKAVAPAEGAAEDAPTNVFVKLTCPSEGRIVPEDVAGRQAMARGKLVMEEMDEATARHMAEDAGATAEEIEAIKGPRKSLSLNTVGVRVAAKS